MRRPARRGAGTPASTRDRRYGSGTWTPRRRAGCPARRNTGSSTAALAASASLPIRSSLPRCRELGELGVAQRVHELAEGLVAVPALRVPADQAFDVVGELLAVDA